MKWLLTMIIISCAPFSYAHEDLDTEILRLEDKLVIARDKVYQEFNETTTEQALSNQKLHAAQTNYFELRLDIIELKLESILQEMVTEKEAREATLGPSRLE